MITEKQIKTILEAHQARIKTGLETELLLSEIVFSVECLLDNKVSEGRKS